MESTTKAKPLFGSFLNQNFFNQNFSGQKAHKINQIWPNIFLNIKLHA